jgi:UDP-N-acetylglucosamine acyltransferase
VAGTSYAKLQSVNIHPTAVIDPSAVISQDCHIGPFCVIGPKVTIGPGNILKSHVNLQGPLTVGSKNVFFPFCVIGEIPQDRKFSDENSNVIIGDNNTFRESVTINRGTEGGGMTTRIGNHNLLMAYTHVAHDCILNNHCVLANGVNLAGHVEIHSHAILGGIVGVTQFNRIGSYAYIGSGSMIRKDVLPYTLGKGSEEYKVQGVNLVGLKRSGFKTQDIQEIKRVYRILVTQNHTFEAAKKVLAEIRDPTPYITQMIQFCHSTQNGIYRNKSESKINVSHPSPP